MSRPSVRAVPPPTPAAAAPAERRALLDQSDALGERLFRYQQAIYGFADLLAFVSTNQEMGPGGKSIAGWSHLAAILADEGARIDEAFGVFDEAMRRIVPPPAGDVP